MTTYQDPQPQSRRAVRQGERGETPEQQEQVPFPGQTPPQFYPDSANAREMWDTTARRTVAARGGPSTGCPGRNIRATLGPAGSVGRRTAVLFHPGRAPGPAGEPDALVPSSWFLAGAGSSRRAALCHPRRPSDHPRSAGAGSIPRARLQPGRPQVCCPAGPCRVAG